MWRYDHETPRIIIIQLLAILACAVICSSTNVSAGAAENPMPSGLVKGNYYYLSVYTDGQPPYLHPNDPFTFNHTSILNKVTVKSNSSVNFPWPRDGMRSYKDYYVNDPDLGPRLSLIVNSGSSPGKVLRFEIWFDFDGEAKTSADADAKAKFDDYVTKSSNTTELIDLKATSIDGTLKDFNFGTVKLVVWRLDTINDDMFIYCGAFNRTSWMVIPYQFEKYDPTDDDSAPGNDVFIAIGVLAIGLVILIAIAIIYYRNKSTPSGNENDGDDEDMNEDQRHSKRRKKSEKHRKTSAFYRKNR